MGKKNSNGSPQSGGSSSPIHAPHVPAAPKKHSTHGKTGDTTAAKVKAQTEIQAGNLRNQNQTAQKPENERPSSSGNVKAILLLLFALLITSRLRRIMEEFYRPKPRYCCGIIPIYD